MSDQQQTEQPDLASPFRLQTNPQPGPTVSSPAAPHIPELGEGGPMGPNTAQALFGHFADGPTIGGVTVPAGNPGGAVAPAVSGAGAAATTGSTTAAPAPATVAAPPHHTPTRDEYHSTVDGQLDTEIKANRKTRGDLDKAKKDKAPTADATQHQLNGDREHLLEELNERSGVYDASIKGVNAQLGDKLPKNLTPEQKALMAKRTELEQEKGKYADQQTALQRWHDRREINSINEKLKDPKLDPKERQTLQAQKKKLATGLLSTTKSYQQFDDRWGSSVYGKDKSYTTMTEAGCGPTGLSMMLDFADQEDPEGKHSQGNKDPYTPRIAADYATNHGRVKGDGTDGSKMMGDLGQGFPGFTGNTLNNTAAASESLHNGIPVMFLGHNVHGTRADGADTKYGGHYMLLNGVSDDNKKFDVHDGGRNANRNIRTISNSQLDDGATGFWNVSHNQ